MTNKEHYGNIETFNEETSPEIYQISWVTDENFDPDKISIIENPSTDMYERSKILYQYSPNAPKRDLNVTVPRNPKAYIHCRGVQKDVYSRKDSTKIETNRYGAQLILDTNNSYHVNLYNTFAQIITRVKDLTGANVSFPVKEMESYSILYTNLIHANDGRMFSSAYTEEEQLNILNCKQCVVRPALVLSILRKSPSEVKIRVQISQMYVHKEIKNFPLAHMD